MKKIALILAVVMLFSAVSVFAAPSVEHIFYDEVANKYYVFGTYQNSVIKNTPVITEELGLFVDDGEITKSFVYDGLNTQNEAGVTKFGMALYTPKVLDTFKVTPYSVNDVKTEYGIEREYDKTTDKRKLSSDATLKTVTFERASQATTNFFMTPAFDPNVLSYTIKGNFSGTTSNNLNATKAVIKYTLSDPKATIYEEEFATENDGTTSITVKAEDGSKKTYTFTFENYTFTSIPTTATEILCLNWSTETVTDTGLMDLLSYPLSKTRKSALIQFKISKDKIEEMLNAPYIGMCFGGTSYSSVGEYNNVRFSLKKVTLEEGYKIDKDTSYNDVEENKIHIGDEASSIIVPTFTKKGTYNRFTMDVTDSIKEALQNRSEETTITYELSIDDYDLPENATVNTMQFRMYSVRTANDGNKINLLY